MADFRDTLAVEIKEKLQILFDRESNESLTCVSYLQSNRPMQFQELREFQERINSCKLKLMFFKILVKKYVNKCEINASNSHFLKMNSF